MCRVINFHLNLCRVFVVVKADAKVLDIARSHRCACHLDALLLLSPALAFLAMGTFLLYKGATKQWQTAGVQAQLYE